MEDECSCFGSKSPLDRCRVCKEWYFKRLPDRQQAKDLIKQYPETVKEMIYVD